MIPLFDPDIVRRGTPFVTIGFISVSVLVFVYQLFLDDLGTLAFTYTFGVIPQEILVADGIETIGIRDGFGIYRVEVVASIPAWGTVFTSMFMHGGFMHLAGNMVYLWVFGNSMESRMGSPIFAVFYLAAGVAAVFAQAYTDPFSTIPMVGASGAVAGILGAYLVLYPTSRIDTLVMVGIITSIRVPAYVLLGIWLFLQLFNGLGSLGPEVANTGGVAYFAGILGAYLVLYPTSRIDTLVMVGIITSIRVPAYVLLGIWLFLQLFNGLGSLGPEVANTGGVAYFAHIGGFVAGLAVGGLYRLSAGRNGEDDRKRCSP